MLFTVPVGIPYWDLGEHESMIIALFLPIIYCRKWRGTSKIKRGEMSSGTARALNIELTRLGQTGTRLIGWEVV